MTGTQKQRHPRYLIMTASIGSGHIKAAEAIAREVRRVDEDAIIEIVDFMSRGVSTLHWLMKRIYLLMLAFVPDLYDRYYLAWQDYRVSPMAANLQLIFYRDGKGHVLVKLLHNEEEAYLPLPDATAPYYDWEAVRRLFTQE